MRRPPEPLTREEAVSLIEACPNSKTGVRNRAIIAVLWRSQLRISEALSLRLVHYEKDRLRVLKAKGGKYRVVGLDKKTRSLIEAWLEVRPTSDLLFCTMKGWQLKDTSTFRKLFKRLQNRAGVNKRCHPHGMRHTGAAELAREGVPLILISQQLGHSNSATTDAYIRHLAGDEVVKVIKKRKW